MVSCVRVRERMWDKNWNEMYQCWIYSVNFRLNKIICHIVLLFCFSFSFFNTFVSPSFIAYKMCINLIVNSISILLMSHHTHLACAVLKKSVELNWTCNTDHYDNNTMKPKKNMSWADYLNLEIEHFTAHQNQTTKEKIRSNSSSKQDLFCCWFF